MVTINNHSSFEQQLISGTGIWAPEACIACPRPPQGKCIVKDKAKLDRKIAKRAKRANNSTDESSLLDHTFLTAPNKGPYECDFIDDEIDCVEHLYFDGDKKSKFCEWQPFGQRNPERK